MPCKTESLLCFFLTFSGGLFAASPPPAHEYDYEDPPQGLFVEEWMEMRLNGDKAGWNHLTYTRRGDEIHTRSDSYMKMARGLVPIEVRTSERTVESVEGVPYRFETRMTMSGQEVVTMGTIIGDEVSVTTKGPGYAGTQVYPFNTSARMTWGLTRLTFDEGFELGTKYEALVYTPSISAQQSMPTTSTVDKAGVFDYLGSPLQGLRMTSVMQAGPTRLATVSWATPDGRLLVTETEMMGMVLSMIVVDQETALKEFVPPEFFLSSLIELKRGIPRDAQEVTYALWLEKGSLKNNLPPESFTQKVVWDAETSQALVTVRRAPHRALSMDVSLPMKSGIATFLKSNLVINSADPQVVALAEKAPPGKEESSLETAYGLTDFVYRYIEKKHLGVAFATASEVAQDPQGDCSEHAVLLAALGRVKNIPSRVAAGLLYLPSYEGRENVMGYHLWTQFHIGGQWLDFDATTGEHIAGPTRIALYYSSLEEESLAELGLALYDRIGNLGVEVVAVEQDSVP